MTNQAIVLAAGKGTRMRTTLPKVLHPVAGVPMLVRVLNTLAAGGFDSPVVVLGPDSAGISAIIGNRVRIAIQDLQRGTGDAAAAAMASLPQSTERVLMVHGDEPLIEADTYRQMLDCQQASSAPVVLLTTHAHDLRGFGRVIRDPDGRVTALVQEGDLTSEQRAVTEVNLGAYVFDAGFLRRALSELQPHPPKNEQYLTDVVALARSQRLPVEAICVEGGEDIMGINDLHHLEQATRYVYHRTARHLMASGVVILDSTSTFIDDDVCIAADTVIHPFTIISGQTEIGSGCEIGPSAHIVSSQIGERSRILSSTVRDSRIGDDVTIGPYAHIRGHADIGNRCEILTHAEIKGSHIGAGTKMHHFGYIGDSDVGERVNIGAGVITCNFDGKTKHHTVIGDDAFIGSDTMLRAPVTIGARAFTGAGSVVTKDVPSGVTVAGTPARVLRKSTEEKEG